MSQHFKEMPWLEDKNRDFLQSEPHICKKRGPKKCCCITELDHLTALLKGICRQPE